MNTDRLFILLIAATGLLVLLVGWEWALVESVEQVELGAWVETAVAVGLAVAFVLILIGIWAELRRVDE